MIGLLFSNPLAFVAVFGILLLSIALHEYAHCLVTDKLGDPTPRAKGRLTLNPLAHLDLIGTLAILFTRFGWGKSAPYDPYNLKEPVRDAALIAAAGPLTNLGIATLASIGLQVGGLTGSIWGDILSYTILTNLGLAIFNLVPVGPLDGAKIIVALLPKQSAVEYEDFMQQYGTFVLILLIFPWAGGSSPVSQLISPLIGIVAQLLL